ncbi:hypothetical protein IVIADoCa2_20 [Xanthomonas phage vB_Xar_IVIA-DoCa2]|uniref:Uncharacterized protein n=1 Tax=Xanthomonas phage vB_Xar_IVIA-DoCa2 TaxID=2970491 RepID=A0A976SGZ0_9CAUD|nr:hypothetical protein IVIADoCa2_20 [Xanthomonas phage vB_Xar_IVIA-DoCa2]
MRTPELPFKPVAMHPTGSAFMCDPPVQNTDEDWLVLSDSPLTIHELEGLMKRDGWTRCVETDAENYAGDVSYGDTWIALRKGHYNIMLTECVGWYMRSCAATMLCKAMNLQMKEHRKHLFRAIRDGAVFDAELVKPLGSRGVRP